jgi:ABC-type amino acid transport substrate-binding protein
VLPISFDHYYVGMGMPQGSPLREPINRALLKAMGNGDWNRFLERYIGGSF